MQDVLALKIVNALSEQLLCYNSREISCFHIGH